MKRQDKDRYDRQSFLGPEAQEKIARCVVGVAGLGGGGSHIVQQLAHIGFKRYVLFDADIVEETNLNRLVGARTIDVPASTSKIHIATMTILGLQPDAQIEAHPCRWQDDASALEQCHLLFGCVDSFAERDALEKAARRFLIPYLDIGMKVTVGSDGIPVMGGQVILSLPDFSCMQCLGFLTPERLADEARDYGDTGPAPQVIWPNGVLASTAVGIGVDLVTDWTRSLRGPVYLSYDGNKGTLAPHLRFKNLRNHHCPHYPMQQVGNPSFRTL